MASPRTTAKSQRWSRAARIAAQRHSATYTRRAGPTRRSRYQVAGTRRTSRIAATASARARPEHRPQPRDDRELAQQRRDLERDPDADVARVGGRRRKPGTSLASAPNTPDQHRHVRQGPAGMPPRTAGRSPGGAPSGVLVEVAPKDVAGEQGQPDDDRDEDAQPEEDRRGAAGRGAPPAVRMRRPPSRSYSFDVAQYRSAKPARPARLATRVPKPRTASPIWSGPPKSRSSWLS